MDSKKLEQYKNKLYAEMRERKAKGENPFKDADFKRRYDYKSAWEMVGSILAYDWNKDDGETAKQLLDWELNDRYHSYLEEYVKRLGYDVVLNLIQQEMDDIDHIEIAVFTDSDSLTYNSIVYKNN